MIPQIPYGAIGLGIAFLVGIWAVIMAETPKGKIILVGIMVFLFFLRVLWTGTAGFIVSLVGWILFALFCLVFIKWKGVGIRG